MSTPANLHEDIEFPLNSLVALSAHYGLTGTNRQPLGYKRTRVDAPNFGRE